MLQDFCLFYFKTPKVRPFLLISSLPCHSPFTCVKSQDLTALGMITLPSYKIVVTNEKKHLFSATHSNMRTYCFQTETEEEMKGWIGAMQLASVCRYH